MNTIPCPPMNDPRYIDIYTIIYHTTRTTIRNLEQHRKNLAFYLNRINRLIDTSDESVDKIYMDWALAASRALAALDTSSNALTQIYAAMLPPTCTPINTNTSNTNN